MNVGEHLVSVVVPAYNACSTIDETLRSVRSQSHQNLEIIVVDDGSSDGTSAIAQEHASRDPRLRIIKQENAGVAAARNTGWTSARSDLVAFVDADDLWAPENLERQLVVMLSAGKQTGLVYSWSVIIDPSSRVRMKAEPAFFSGDVLNNIFGGNFVGNGSAVLVRRQALEAAKGFDSNLHANGAQGCEDYLFYCRVAEHFNFSVVPEYLVGYRYSPENMSSNLPRMLKSWIIVMDEMLTRYPDRRETLNDGLRKFSTWLVQRALIARKLNYLISVLIVLTQRDPQLASKIFAQDLPRDISTALFRKVSRKLFKEGASLQAIELFPTGDPS